MTRTGLLLGVILALCMSVPTRAQGNGNNECDLPIEAPDIIVGGFIDIGRYGTQQGITAFALGTESCNIGSCQGDWIANTPAHPVIGQNLFRLKDGRFEQLGQSWLKHGFGTLNNPLCSDACIPSDGQHLGVNCSDPYGSGLNGSQTLLGPKFEINAATGEHVHPATDMNQTGPVIYKRLQVYNVDLDPALNPGALYFVEAQYVTADDAAAGNNRNNNSYQQVIVTGSDPNFDLQLIGSIEQEEPAIHAWAAADPTVRLADVDGFVVASKVSVVELGQFRYEYAIQNLISHDSARSFTVPVPANATITNVGFHDVDYHSGEPYPRDDWEVTFGGDTITWSTQTFDENENANALRWGTLYNFRFDANVGPFDGPTTLGVFRPVFPSALVWQTQIPNTCGDAICQAHEDCGSCAIDCETPTTCCGDGTCEGDETACNCPNDCGLPPVAEGICADGEDNDCDGAIDCDDADCCGSATCPGGTGVCCNKPADCDDGLFCGPDPICFNKVCTSTGNDPCPGQQCDERNDVCVECLSDSDCNDGVFCNGVEACVDHACQSGADPCPGQECDELGAACAECIFDADCDDGLFCNGAELCNELVCGPGDPVCDGQPCDEKVGSCVGGVQLQPRMGEPLLGLTIGELQRFQAGRALFDTILTEAQGLGPNFNQNSCGSCHSRPLGGSGSISVVRFGQVDGKSGAFDPMESLGGSLLQSEAFTEECVEHVPPEANHTALRGTTSTLGLGLIEAVTDGSLRMNEIFPPAGISGRTHNVHPPESPGTSRIGRFGWKSQQATVLGFSADAALNEMGLTNRFFPNENLPNGDAVLLAKCDAVADPEDAPDASGFDFVDRVTDFQRFLAAPPQTPRSGMIGEGIFNAIGCVDCHVAQFTTLDWEGFEAAIRNKSIRPYSDFLLHDMGQAADFVPQGDAQAREIRTAPLWGLRVRDPLWHDHRINGATFADRIRQAIAEHDALGSEARPSAQSFNALTVPDQDALIVFLDSLGRAEFDQDGDGDVDGDDYQQFEACRNGPGDYGPDDSCAISDIDLDGDVDDDDFTFFLIAAEGLAGVLGDDVTLTHDGSQVTLSWGSSCASGDSDYAVYEGALGDFSSHLPLTCSTAGQTSYTVTGGRNSSYFLIVPTNGFREGSYGLDSNGGERIAAAAACLPQALGACD